MPQCRLLSQCHVYRQRIPTTMRMTLCLVLAVVLTFSYTEGSTTFNHAPLVYNYNDVMAQAACTAKATTRHRIWAIRRDCAGGKLTCNEVCRKNRLACFQTYQVYKNPTILAQNADSDPDEAVRGLSMRNFVYNSRGCAYRAGLCGPNYCCCKGPLIVY